MAVEPSQAFAHERVEVRPAVPGDAAVIALIHNQGVEERGATFQTRPSVPDDFRARIDGVDRRLLLVAVGSRGDVLGWAAVVPISTRPVYSGVGEYQIYIERDARGRGVGARLLTALVEAAESEGYWKLIGKLFTTNLPSIALAHGCGFRDVGVHLRHGRLEGEWRDVLLVERLIGIAA